MTIPYSNNVQLGAHRCSIFSWSFTASIHWSLRFVACLLREKMTKRLLNLKTDPTSEIARGDRKLAIFDRGIGHASARSRLYCGQSGEDWGRSGRGVQLLVLERHVKAGRRTHLKEKTNKNCLVCTTQPKDDSSLAGLFRETGGWWGPHPRAPAPAPVTRRLCTWLSCLRDE